MKFYIGVDCEGVACGVGSPGGSLNASRNLDFCRKQATREADAAAQALFAAGAERVVVWDNHNGSLNLDYELLDERCEIALGVGFQHRWPELDESFSGVLFIGYHARDNTVDAAMAHTFSSTSFQWMRINGREVGEFAVDAAMAGRFGVPPILVASDDKALREAEGLFPGIEAVRTKTAYGWNAAVSKHPKRVCDEIGAATTRALGRLDQFRPFGFGDGPLTLEIRYKRIDAADAAARGFKAGERVDAHTVRWRLEKLEEWF